jgi:hypothetical protein
MMTMEFEELKQIWDSQANKPSYVIDEKALHNRILSKKNQARHIANVSELLLIVVNAGAGSFVLGINIFAPGGNAFMYLMAAWMFITSLYLLVSRIRRVRGSNRFDWSMQGDLDYAISTATYQVRLSLLMRWNILPIGLLCLLGLWEGGKSILAIVLIVISFALANYMGAWDHKIYKTRKRELEILKAKLENEG